jgi:hypothetical protein
MVNRTGDFPGRFKFSPCSQGGASCPGGAGGGSSAVSPPSGCGSRAGLRWENRLGVEANPRSVEAERHYAVGPHPAVLREEDYPLQIGLRNDQTIERIVVMRRQAAGMLGMGTRHRQDLEAERQHCSDDRSIKAELPDRPVAGHRSAKP